MIWPSDPRCLLTVCFYTSASQCCPAFSVSLFKSGSCVLLLPWCSGMCCASCFYLECHNTGWTVKCVKALKSSNLSVSYSLTDLIQATQESNVNIPQMADTLFERAGNASWVVVFKALVTTNHLMVHGNEVRSKQLISVILLTWYLWDKQDLRQCPDIFLNESNNYY